jgi:hypothetical protein
MQQCLAYIAVIAGSAVSPACTTRISRIHSNDNVLSARFYQQCLAYIAAMAGSVAGVEKKVLQGRWRECL